MNVERGGPAIQSSVPDGDMTVVLDDQLVANVDDLHRLLTHVTRAASCELDALRNDDRVDLRVAFGEA